MSGGRLLDFLNEHTADIVLAAVGGMVRELLISMRRKTILAVGVLASGVVVSIFAGVVASLMTSPMDWPWEVKAAIVGLAGFGGGSTITVINAVILRRLRGLVHVADVANGGVEEGGDDAKP